MKPNVAVVILDTLRKDYFDNHFDWLPGTSYSRAFSPSHWTIPTHASLYTGFYPSELGVTAKSPALDCEPTTVAEALTRTGYRTRLFTTNPQIFVWDDWERGFDEVVPPSRIPPEADGTFKWNRFKSESSRDGWSLYVTGVLNCIRSEYPTLKSIRRGIQLSRGGTSRAGDLRRRISRTEFGDGGEFLLLNLMDSHTPYDPPKEYATVETPQSVTVAEGLAGGPSNPDTVRQAYDDAARYLTHEYREIHEELEPIFDYIITLSDHGELLGEDGWWNHGIGLRPELCHVPLNVSGEGFPNETTDTQVSLVDIPTTIADLTGADLTDGTRGVDLRSPPTDRELLTEFHGLLPFHRNQFERHNVADRYDEFDEQYDGVVTPDGYAYRTPEDGVTVLGKVSDPEQTITEMRATVPYTASEAVEGVSTDVEDRLHDLGYA